MEKIQGTILTILNDEKICLVQNDTNAKEYFVLSMTTLPKGVMVSVGDAIEFEPIYFENNIPIALNPVLLSNVLLDELRIAMENKDILRAEVVNFNNGGLELNYKGYKCFMPYSMTMISKDEDFGIERLMNTEIDFQVVNIIDSKIIVSRNREGDALSLSYIEKELKHLKPGVCFTGTVTKIIGFGIYVKCIESEGFLFIDDIFGMKTNKRIKGLFNKHSILSQIFTKDDQVYVEIQKVKGSHYRLKWNLKESRNEVYKTKMTDVLGMYSDMERVLENVKKLSS